MVVPTATGTRSSAAAQQEMTIDGAPLRSRVLLWAVALALGSVTAVGVWLFDQAIDLVGRVVRDVLVPALGPIGVWGIVPILALACLLVAGIVRFTRPEKLAAMGHIIDGVAEHEGHLDQHNAAVVVSGAAVGLGMGMPLGADTPSAMIGGHLGSWIALRLGWPTVFVQSLIVAGVAQASRPPSWRSSRRSSSRWRSCSAASAGSSSSCPRCSRWPPPPSPPSA